MADASVRPARPADVAEIARIQLSTWRTAYAAVLPAEVLAAATDELARQQWSVAVTEAPSAVHRVFVAMEGSALVGFAAAEPDPAAGGTAGVVSALLVEPRWGRRGHGSRLVSAVVEHAGADGWTVLTTWVLDGDVASTRFFESAGFARDGWVRTLDATGGTIREVRLHTALVDTDAEGEQR